MTQADPSSPASPHIMVVESRFYGAIADALWAGAEQALAARGATHERVTVPGAFEVPAAIALAVEAMDRGTVARPFDGFVALGCVLRGETTHYDYVCTESARALQDLACRRRLAIGYGILTCENAGQAWERARMDRKDKGGDAVQACLAMVDLRRRLGLTSH